MPEEQDQRTAVSVVCFELTPAIEAFTDIRKVLDGAPNSSHWKYMTVYFRLM